MKAIKFRNFSNEDFSWKFDGVLYTFPAGQETYLEEDKAHHFAKHLVDREINKKNVEMNLHKTPNEIPTNNLKERKVFEDQCFPSNEEITPMEAIDLNEKAKKPKKKEAEFEDLQVKPKKKI